MNTRAQACNHPLLEWMGLAAAPEVGALPGLHLRLTLLSKLGMNGSDESLTAAELRTAGNCRQPTDQSQHLNACNGR